MKKILMGLGMAALLSSCLDTGLVYVDAFKIRFSSEYRVGSKSYICDNKETNVYVEFEAVERQPGALVGFKGTLFGENIPGYTIPAGNFLVPENASLYEKSGSTYRYVVTIPPRSAPTTAPLKPQAVVVVPTPKPVPTNPIRIGSSILRLEVTDSAGGRASGSFGDSIDVINNCN